MLKMIDENYKATSFRLGRKGVVAYGFRSSIPISIRQVKHDATQRVGGMVGGAIAGDVLLGPVGLLAGAMLGGKGGTVYFVLRLLDGREIACYGKPKEYRKAAARVNRYFHEIRQRQGEANRLNGMAEEGRLQIAFSLGTIMVAIALGPFYAFRCGWGYGFLALLVTVITGFMSWPLVGLGAIALYNRNMPRKRESLKAFSAIDLEALQDERQAGFRSEFGMSA